MMKTSGGPNAYQARRDRQVIRLSSLVNPMTKRKPPKPRDSYVVKFICASKAQAHRLLRAAKELGARHYLGSQ